MTETCRFRVTRNSLSFTCENEGIDSFVSLVETEKVRINVWRTAFLKEDVLIFQPVSPEGLKTCKVDPIFFGVEDIPQKNIFEFIEETEKEDAIVSPSVATKKGIKWLTFKVAFPKNL